MGKFAAWVGYLIVLLGLPQLFDSVLAITIFNQMAIAIVFALSYNMLLGQGGMLSFGHAVYFGLGGFMAVHALIMIEFETVYFSIPDSAGGWADRADRRGFRRQFLYAQSRDRVCDDFAGHRRTGGCLVINLCQFFWWGGGSQRGSHLWSALFWSRILPGCGDLLPECRVGLCCNRVYVSVYPDSCWAHGQCGSRQSRAGRVHRIQRPARALYLVLHLRFFAGVAGGLFALNYEFITEENLNAVTSGRVLLMAYIGGLGYFIGPIIGAVVLTLMNSLLSNYTELWMLYLGMMFVLTVLFLPRGFAGFIMMHQTAWLRGKLSSLFLPYLITGMPAIIFGGSILAAIEMLHHEGEPFGFLFINLDSGNTLHWLALTAFAAASYYACRRSLGQLNAAWEEANRVGDPTEGGPG